MGWSQWEDLGGVITSSPSVASWGRKRLDVFARGPEGAMWHQWFEGGWKGWESLGNPMTGPIQGAPSAVSWGDDRIDCFARGVGDTMVHKYWNGKSWSSWDDRGGKLASAVGAASWGHRRLDCFVRGPDGALWHTWFDDGWKGWESMGQPMTGPLVGEPGVVSWGKKRVDIFCRGTNDSLWHKWFDDGWKNWEDLGGILASPPTVCSWDNKRLDVFARGPDGCLWHKYFKGSWTGWENLGGEIEDAPCSVSWGNERIDVFARGPKNTLVHMYFDDSLPNRAIVLPPPKPQQVAAAAPVVAPAPPAPEPVVVAPPPVVVAPPPVVVAPPPPPPPPPPKLIAPPFWVPSPMDWEKVKTMSAVKDELVLDGRTWTLVDQITFLDEASEAAHGFRIAEATEADQTRQRQTYPDGTALEAAGRAHVGGYAEFKISRLTPGKPTFILRRIDYGTGDYEVEYFLDGVSAGKNPVRGSDQANRWRNWPFVIRGSFVTAETMTFRQVAPPSGVVNLFHVWVYQSG